MPILGANTQSIADTVLNRVRADQGPIYEAAAKVEGFSGRMDEVEGIADDVNNRVDSIEPAVISLEMRDTRISLRAEGLSLDGTTDETAAFQSVIANAPDGAVISLDNEAVLRVTSQITWSGKQLSIQGQGGAIKLTTKLTVPFLQATNAANSSVMDVNLIGPETSFDGVLDSQAYAVYFDNCDDATLQSIDISGFSRGGMVKDSDRVSVDDFTFAGMAASHFTNVNFHTTLVVRNSHYIKVGKIHGQNCGSTILVGWQSNNGSVAQATGHNNYDNGVYVSSGDGWQIIGPIFTADPAYTGTIGSGVKMRGSTNTLIGGRFENLGNGAVLTGTGGTATGGYDGWNSKIIGATAINCQMLGFAIEPAATTPCRNMELIGNTAVGCGWNSGANVASIRVMQGAWHRILYNTVIDHKNGTAAILVQGESLANKMLRPEIVGNFVRNPALFAMQLTYVNQPRVAFSTFDTVANAAYGMRLVGTTNGDISETVPRGTVGTTSTIGIHDTDCTGNTVHDNLLSTVTNNGGTSNVTYANANNNPVVTGSRGGNAALASLLQRLVEQRRITDSTTA